MNDRFAFMHAYEVEVSGEFAAETEEMRFYYPSASRVGGRDGLIVRVTTTPDRNWVGVFAFGGSSNELLSGVWSHPDPSTVCVVARSKGYFVNVDKPQIWSEAIAFPVTAVLPIPSLGLLLFADLDRISAYGRGGIAWESRKLSWDGIQIVGVEGDRLEGLAHDPTKRTPVPFSVDLRTGAATGGSTPDDYIRR